MADKPETGSRMVPEIWATGGFLPPDYLFAPTGDRPPLARRIRFRLWRRRSWYALREAIAKLILPDGPWHESGWDD